MIEQSGVALAVATRTVAAADTSHPNDTNPAAAAIFRQPNVRSRVCWLAVHNTAAVATSSVVVTVYVSKDGTGAQATAGSWRRHGQLFNGTPITPTYPAGGTTHTNRIAAIVAIPAIAGFPYVYCEVTAGAGGVVPASTVVTMIAEDM